MRSMVDPKTTPARHRWTAIIAVATVALLGAIVSPVVTAVSPASADVPSTPVAAFTAPLCVGATNSDPTNDPNSPFGNLLSVSGQRLVDYNNGQPVHLYNNSGTGGFNADGSTFGSTPSCVVRYDAATDAPVSSWAFCTYDRALTCSSTNAAGQLVRVTGTPQVTTVYPGLQDISPDARLTVDQRKLQAYIAQTPLAVAAGPNWNGGTIAAPTTADDSTSASRNIRQGLLHCIDNPNRGKPTPTSPDTPFQVFCANNMSAATQARILEMIGPDFADQLGAASTGVVYDAGGVGQVEVTTTLAGMPIELAATGGSITGVCAGPATLTGTTLVVDATAPLPATVALCVTRPDAGTVTVSAAAQPPAVESFGYVQSRPGGTDTTTCQIYTGALNEERVVLTASAPAAFDEDGAPAIGTTLVDDLDGDHHLVQAGGTVTDTVAYTGLLPSTEYTVSGELMDQETGAATGITGSTTFTSSATGTGTVEVAFTISDAWAGRILTAFEVLTLAGAEVASHEDLDDAAQTVWIADIGTTLVDLIDGDKIIDAIGGTVVDTVAYENLVPSTEYTMSGELYDKATGLATGIVGSVDFTSSPTGNGTVEVAFVIPAGWAGTTLVAFEVLTQGAAEIAVHEDLDDLAQTVTVRSETPSSPVLPGSALVGTGAEAPIGALVLAGLLTAGGAAMLMRRRRSTV